MKIIPTIRKALAVVIVINALFIDMFYMCLYTLID
jgi:hypothetical protein